MRSMMLMMGRVRRYAMTVLTVLQVWGRRPMAIRESWAPGVEAEQKWRKGASAGARGGALDVHVGRPGRMASSS